MKRKEALQQAAYLATKMIKNHEEAEANHKLLNELFKNHHLSWDEIIDYQRSEQNNEK